MNVWSEPTQYGEQYNQWGDIKRDIPAKIIKIGNNESIIITFDKNLNPEVCVQNETEKTNPVYQENKKEFDKQIDIFVEEMTFKKLQNPNDFIDEFDF